MHEKGATSDVDWTKVVLNRSLDQSQQVLDRAKQRKVSWPAESLSQKSPVQDPMIYTSIDDAFSSVLQFMSTTSRQCKRFYRSCDPCTKSCDDRHHCDRFHTSQFTALQNKNPLQMSEDVHLVVHPGTYAVSAGSWGTDHQQTHVVHVEQGQTVDLDFVM